MSICCCTSVLKGLTKTLCAVVMPVGGAIIVKAVPTAAPVSLSIAVAGTLTIRRCLPTSALTTSIVKTPLASLAAAEVGSVASQALLSFKS